MFLSFLVGFALGAICTLIAVAYALGCIKRMSNYERGFPLENEEVKVEQNVFSEN